MCVGVLKYFGNDLQVIHHLSRGAQGGPDGKQAPLQAGPPDAVQPLLSEL